MQILFLLTLLLVLLLVRPITTTIHEMGHAIPALLFSKESVTIYVGSYGDPASSTVLRWGRFTAYFSWDLAKWNMGVCTHGGLSNFKKAIMVVLGGPLASLLFGLGLVLFISQSNFSETTIFMLTFFTISFIWDFFVNIIPSGSPVKLYNGRTALNDGSQLAKLLRWIRYPEDYFIAKDKMEQKEYPVALTHLQKVQAAGFNDREIFRDKAKVYLLQKDYQAVLKTYADMVAHHKIQPEDMLKLGYVYTKIGDYEGAIKYYSQSLYLDYQDAITLNNRGYAYLQTGNYERAIRDLELAIAYHPEYTDAFNNLGLALIKTNRIEKGYEMLQKSMALDTKNPYVFLHLGFYFEKKGDYGLALQNFQKAKDLGIDHHGIDFYIAEAKREI